MKFYLCHTPEGRKRLITRQDEAKKLDKTAELIDIPVDQAGIKAGYEELFDRIYDLEQSAKDLLPPEAMSDMTKALVKPQTIKEQLATPTVRSVTDWILDEATTAQLEQVFGCIGTRFSELSKEVTALKSEKTSELTT